MQERYGPPIPKEFPYVWTKYPERKGQPCAVWAWGKLNTVGVVWPDGAWTITSRHAIRKRPAGHQLVP